MEIKRLNYPVLNNPREALLLPDGSGKWNLKNSSSGNPANKLRRSGIQKDFFLKALFYFSAAKRKSSPGLDTGSPSR